MGHPGDVVTGGLCRRESATDPLGKHPMAFPSWRRLHEIVRHPAFKPWPLLTGQRVWHMALTPAEDLLFTTNGVTNDVTVIDVKGLKPVKSIKVGRYPWGVAIRPMP